jgi:hypothetical protein
MVAVHTREWPERDIEVVFADCRDRGHAWHDPKANSKLPLWARAKAEGYVVRTMVCPRCWTQRIEEFDSNGERIETPRYHYEEGYLLKPGDGPIRRSEFRSAIVRIAVHAMNGKGQR